MTKILHEVLNMDHKCSYIFVHMFFFCFVFLRWKTDRPVLQFALYITENYEKAVERSSLA